MVYKVSIYTLHILGLYVLDIRLIRKIKLYCMKKQELLEQFSPNLEIENYLMQTVKRRTILIHRLSRIISRQKRFKMKNKFLLPFFNLTTTKP